MRRGGGAASLQVRNCISASAQLHPCKCAGDPCKCAGDPCKCATASLQVRRESSAPLKGRRTFHDKREQKKSCRARPPQDALEKKVTLTYFADKGMIWRLSTDLNSEFSILESDLNNPQAINSARAFLITSLNL